MLQRVIVSTTTIVRRDAHGFSVDYLTLYCESTLAGGSQRRHTERYERLSRNELSDLLEHLADGPLAGEEFRGAGLQLSLI